MFSELFLTFEKALTAKLPSRLVERAEIMHVTVYVLHSVQTVGSGQHPSVVNQTSATEMKPRPSVQLQRHLPRPLVLFRLASADDP